MANMDQTPMAFVCGGGKTYNKSGKKSIWMRGSKSGLEKRLCSVQLTVFADGKARVKPMIIFKGAGKCMKNRLKQEERDVWDKRVHATFQKNVWCSEEVVKEWIEELWEPAIEPLKSKSLLVADVHRAQNTEDVLQMLKAIGTTPASIPGGCTSLV